MIEIIFIIAMFFAWSIGGEKYFGKYRRGLLLTIPMTILGFFTLPWYLLIVQIGVLWAVYQGISYDWGIGAVFSKNMPFKGWAIIGLNGALIGLTATCFMIHKWSISTAILADLSSALGFCAIVYLANSDKCKPFRDWLFKYAPWKFKDSWFVSCGIMGMILAVIILIIR